MALGQKISECNSRVIEAATQLFARNGYHATSTREIARLAEISENTLFRHFEHKEDIFWSTLTSNLSGFRVRKELLEGMSRGDDPEVVLPQILALLVDTVTFRPQILALIVVALIEHRGKAQAVCHEHLSPIFSEFNSYLTRNIEAGRIRDLDPRMITSALAVTVMVQPEISRLITGMLPPQTDVRAVVRAYTKFWLDVLSPSQLGVIRPAMGAASLRTSE
jgi:AcrR family transcriptional regulator